MQYLFVEMGLIKQKEKKNGVNFILQGAEEDISRIEEGTKILQEEWNSKDQEKGEIFLKLR